MPRTGLADGLADGLAVGLVADLVAGLAVHLSAGLAVGLVDAEPEDPAVIHSDMQVDCFVVPAQQMLPALWEYAEVQPVVGVRAGVRVALE